MLPVRKLLNDVITNDQFMPAVAFNSSTGNGRVAFYDCREDPNNVQYKEYDVKINPDGVPISANIARSSFASSPLYYIDKFIGDYQQAWWANLGPTGAQFVYSFIGNPTIAPNYYGDVWLQYVF